MIHDGALRELFTLHRAFRKSVFVPLCLTSTGATASVLLSSRCGRLRQYAANHHEPTGEISRPHDRHIDGFEYGPSGLPIDLESIFTQRHLPRTTEWATLIDPYLPPELRVEVENSAGGQSNSTNMRPINTLPQVLARVRQQSNIDLLSYVGVQQGRWEAVLWLVKKMMEQDVGYEETEKDPKTLSKMLWPSLGENLDDLTGESIHVGSPGFARVSLASVMKNNEEQNPVIGHSIKHKSLAQIWQSLGTMILQAADRSPDDPKYSLIMTQVFRVLGHLHRTSAFPNLIYYYTSPTDQTVLQRPPTLYLLSKRIMSTLSDVEFDLQWKEDVLKFQQQGYELKKPGLIPRIREFGPELWMDLVLWACVEGGWVNEAAWIIRQIERRKASPETQWLVISWQQICARKAPESDWFSILRFQIDKTRLNQIGGIGIATGSDLTVDMGTRTISSEVVMAVLDGLLNIHTADQDTNPVFTLQRIINCKNLLERGHSALDAKWLNAMIVRIIEATGFNDREAPGLLQQILDVRPVTANLSSTESTYSAYNADADDTAAILGLLHRNLHNHAEKDNLRRSLSVFQKIQATVDAKRDQHLDAFATELDMRLDGKDELQDLMDTSKTRQTIALPPPIPVPTLIAFLDLIMENKFYGLGKWLLQNEDIDGGVIDPELYADPNLQPALLRFANASADDGLLTKVLTKIEAPISLPVLHSLLRCQVATGKWPAVQKLFKHFQTTPGASWSASDVFAVAGAILRLEHGPSDIQTKEQLSQAREILVHLLRGQYNSPRDPSEPVNLSEVKLANQLGRIVDSQPDILKTVVTDTSRDINRAHTSVPIPSDAFNIFLGASIDVKGPSAGRALWEQWCRKPLDPSANTSPIIKQFGGRAPVTNPSSVTDAPEKVVTPTRQMLRNILRPILQVRPRTSPTIKITDQKESEKSKAKAPDPSSINNAYVSNPEDVEIEKRPLTTQEQEILDWGVAMYKEFGLSDIEINHEIPGAMPRTLREKVVL